MMTPGQLLGEFLLEVVETALMAALMLRLGAAAFASRMAVALAVGLVAAISTNGSYLVWYGFPTDYTWVNMLVELGKFVAAGLGASLVLRRSRRRR